MTEGRTNTWLSGCGRCLLLTWEMASVILARTFWKVVRTFFIWNQQVLCWLSWLLWQPDSLADGFTVDSMLHVYFARKMPRKSISRRAAVPRRPQSRTVANEQIEKLITTGRQGYMLLAGRLDFLCSAEYWLRSSVKWAHPSRRFWGWNQSLLLFCSNMTNLGGRRDER